MAPSKGKPVSGPGRLSARTDLSPSNPNNRKIQGAIASMVKAKNYKHYKLEHL
jgi:hypothetical protein